MITTGVECHDQLDSFVVIHQVRQALVGVLGRGEKIAMIRSDLVSRRDGGRSKEEG
jgi:hypothetical protein